MYLQKQWRESRILSAIAIVALALLLFAVIKGTIAVNSSNTHGGNSQGMAGAFVALFYMESVLVAFWGWLIASIGIGKNLGEESGSFLFTRPRRRAWFLWSDWAFGMIQIAIIITLTNIMIGVLLNRVRMLMHLSGGIAFSRYANPIPILPLLVLVGFGALLFGGLVYSVTYFSTIVLKRTSGVLLGAGILVAYVVLRAVVAHYYHSIQLPSPIPVLFDASGHTVYGLSDHLALSLAARAGVIMLFPIAAQLILDRSEI